MKSSLILLKSITQANKAKRQLSNYRIKSSVEKTSTRQGGCRYGIRVYEDKNNSLERICRLLSIIGIETNEIIS